MNEKNKMGLISIILLGINAVVGAGVFLLPGDAMKAFGVASIFVYIFDMLLVLSMAFCFAEVAGKFNKNDAAYVYTKEAFGDFCGFEVGLMKWVIGCISWGALIVGFPTSLSAVWAPAGEPHIQKIIIVAMIVGLTIINLLGVSLSKIVQNVITVGKLIPLILFIGIGIFFIKGVNFTSSTMVPPGAGAAALLMFYSFTGFESIAVAAEDMENPQKNIPIAIISVIVIASIIYILNQVVCVGTWLLFQASMHQLIMGLGALAIGVPLYFIMKSYNRKVYGENLKKIV
ncbi:APC family permease [Clostridioides difficile]|uniref:APC family permease n=1 Tax=Clostridioides difficile TaxID=1496 RepID=UPI0018E313C2|nr:APC family permease [Clostridioides difficile]